MKLYRLETGKLARQASGDIITVDNIDYAKRKPNEWAKLYSLKLMTCDDPEKLMNEYEFAWNLTHHYKYHPVPDKNGEYDKASDSELKAEMLAMDIYINAEPKEKYLLDEHKKYIDTNFVRRRIHLI